MFGNILTEFAELTAGNFESSLASDDVLAHYFNDFLSLPCFTVALLYNRSTRLFELVNGAADFVTRRIRTELKRRKSHLLNADPTELTRIPVDNLYTVCCLDKEQGIQWILKERLPFFLQSDCYYEYRLAKLLFQWDPKFFNHKRSSCRPTLSAPQLDGHSQFNQVNNNALKVWMASHSQENLSANKGFSSCPMKCEQTQKLHSSQIELSLSLGVSGPSADIREELHLRESSCRMFASPEQQLEYLEDVVDMVDGQKLANTSEGASKSGYQPSCTTRDKKHSEGADSKTVPDGTRGIITEKKKEWDEKNRKVGSRATNQENPLDMCWHGTCCHGKRCGLDEFKEFLQGTQGRKLFDLWLDIERLKTIQQSERKNRYLVLMRSWYLLSSSQRSLNVELLSRLGLTTSPCWTEEKLRSVQSCLTESLLCYWTPRYWTSQCFEEYCYCSPSEQPCHGSKTLPFLQLDTCLPRSPHSAFTQLLSGRGQLLCSRGVKQMLQALFVESRAGLYFTHFCEQSGNQLWVNAVYFWTDLQHYHELFYQDGLDSYRVQREAQLLSSTYIFSSARRSIDVDEEVRRDVHSKLLPAFEELFDEVEEHALSILLEPWTLLVNGDKEAFQQVCVQDEVRFIDSQEFRELRTLYEESERQLKQREPCRSTPFSPSNTISARFSKGSHALDSWLSVPLSYRRYNLESLLHQPHEIGHFMSFLQNQDASIHLMCWLDLEEYRRTPQKDRAVRQERSSHIAAKYLNRMYFFGSDSPATGKQQNDMLRLTGGLERLKLECLSNPVAMEIQDVVRNHIEETWLPLFLSTAEFTERRKSKPKQIFRRRKVRKEAWKAEGLWMSSSKEILVFRRILLNPPTCQQFQNFVSLKGGFLENDVRFWLEVQRYKDLCHSHSDEATIQQKISTIISCFINSSMPPALQIDIPPDQAQHILDRRHKLGPYIFREAQMSVFSELLKFWTEFQELSSSIQEEQLLLLLQEKRVKCKARVRRQRRKEEEEDERSAQEEQERQESCFREEEEETEDEETEQEGTSEKRQTQSRVLLTPMQPLLWSYSKYMAGLKKEELLLRRQSQLETSSSTVSDSSTECCIKSASSKHSSRQPSSRTDSKQCNRHDRK
ncbi:regulator of G-protein signaling 22 [Odontesthes bonariensis]